MPSGVLVTPQRLGENKGEIVKPKPLKNLTFPVFLLLTEDWIYEKFGAMPIFTMAAVLRPYSTNKLYTPEQFDGKVMIPFEEVKSACEFYLRYKDKPELLLKEQHEFVEDIERMRGTIIKLRFDSYIFIRKYNDWLFKLAFKDVLEDTKKIRG